MPAEPTRSRIGKLTRPLGSTALLRSSRKSWWVPILVAVVLATAGVWTRSAMESAMRAELRDSLESFLKISVNGVKRWLAVHVRTAQHMAADEDLQEIVTNPSPQVFERAVQDVVAIQDYVGYALIDVGGKVIAARNPENIGKRVKELRAYLATDKDVVITPPLMLLGELGMVVMARLEGDRGWIAFSINPARLTERLAAGRPGESGETYAFSEEGTLLSYSRFEGELVELGLIEKGQRSILNIAVRNPGGNMAEGFAPTEPVKARPLTRMAASAVAQGGNPRIESDIDGYPDYRGVPVVGAWKWLDEYDFGVAVEMDVTEAYYSLSILHRVIWVLLSLLGAAAIGAAFYNFALQKMRAKVSEAAQLGQYTLGEKIGEGGMGQVYRAEHSMLKRPTAIKLLPSDEADNERRVRFEREVQMTARLAHHNTVAIYDYGTSPEGAFYYAMEFVDGITVHDMVADSGPLPPARAVHLLKQACGSLAEAHELQLIHRDLKPANVMVTNRPGMWDHVKILDFGLVKALGQESTDVSVTGMILGTPRYLSPE
ncbi:MAG: protein kinase domain-containing protein, partial [Planctomycetota bacterium]